MGIINDKRLNIIIGAYGSGKSELSVNMALMMKEKKPGNKILLADLDIVNPFYRSADAARKLGEDGIRVIYPSYANSNVDAPVLSGEMYVIFDDEEYSGVFDIGGEDMGAYVLGSLYSRLKGMDFNLYMVVNTRRPFTSDPESIAVMTAELEEASRLKIDGYICNTNLLEETTVDEIIEGEQVIMKAGELTGIPLVATSVMEDLIDDERLGELKAPELIRMRRTIHYDY
jgi:energy-coupling factor transporter ATP-binding protein EcfA2